MVVIIDIVLHIKSNTGNSTANTFYTIHVINYSIFTVRMSIRNAYLFKYTLGLFEASYIYSTVR